jgi:uncharacterized protein YsxB (DUF464 family)
MIKVEIVRDEDGKVSEFRSKGHNGFDADDKDIVCAGASALLQTTVLGLESYLRLDPEVEHEKGWLSCKLERDVYLNREIDALVETMILGLRALENSYPDHIQVEEVSNVRV